MQSLYFIASLGVFVIGLIMLVLGSDYLIQAATAIAKHYGVSDLLIGLTIVAIGTSLPEIVASTVAILSDKMDLAYANVIGSSITNLTLVVGIGALVAPLATNHIVLDRDTKIMILVFAVLTAILLNPLTLWFISFLEAIILLLLLLAYLSFLHWGRAECDNCYQFKVFVDFFVKGHFLTSLAGRAPSPQEPEAELQQTSDSAEPVVAALDLDVEPSENVVKDLVIIAIAAVAITIGAEWVVWGAEFISLSFGISEGVIGFTIIALGSALPEITVAINSARYGFGRLLIGNVVGSNIVNVTLALGLGSLIASPPVSMSLAMLLSVMMLIVSFIFYYIIREGWRVTRKEGVVLLAVYFVSLIVLLFAS